MSFTESVYQTKWLNWLVTENRQTNSTNAFHNTKYTLTKLKDKNNLESQDIEFQWHTVTLYSIH